MLDPDGDLLSNGDARLKTHRDDDEQPPPPALERAKEPSRDTQQAIYERAHRATLEITLTHHRESNIGVEGYFLRT